MSEESIALSTRLRYRAVGNEGVMVHLHNGRVMVVNEVGLFLVRELGRGATTASALAGAVVREFEVDFEQAHGDVESFVTQLREENAIDVGPPVDGCRP